MEFTQTEARFLMSEHGAVGLPGHDLGIFWNCPKRILNDILEGRAQRLGNAFTAFRAEQRSSVGDLDSQIEAAKPF